MLIEDDAISLFKFNRPTTLSDNKGQSDGRIRSATVAAGEVVNLNEWRMPTFYPRLWQRHNKGMPVSSASKVWTRKELEERTAAADDTGVEPSELRTIDDLKDASQKQLQEECRRIERAFTAQGNPRHVPVRGKKEDVIDRIRDLRAVLGDESIGTILPDPTT